MSENANTSYLCKMKGYHKNMKTLNMLFLREAFEASWDENTSYLRVKEDGNPALGQCYPTAKIVQEFFPELEIVKGEVKTTKGTLEVHFWNVTSRKDAALHIDLTWQQFPFGSKVVEYRILDRNKLGDGPVTKKRCSILRERVQNHISEK